MMPAISVQEKAGDFWSSSYQSPNLNSSSFQVFLRGSGNQVCIVDDIYIPFGQVQLDPNQIESITVLTDILDKAKYGPMASDGALLIRTKKADTTPRCRFTWIWKAASVLPTAFLNG